MSSYHLKLTNKLSCYVYLQQKQISKLSSVLIHTELAVCNFFGFDRETASNEYLGIDSKERFNEKIVWLRKQPNFVELVFTKNTYIARPPMEHIVQHTDACI